MEEIIKNSNGVYSLTLDQLKETHKENYANGLPVMGIYHFAFIERLLELLQAAGISYEVNEIFAADNRDRYRPGVTILQDVVNQHNDVTLDAHIFRRVYANINLKNDLVKGEVSMNMAVAYHQKGIQVAFGPYVHVCHNQTILGAQDVFSTTSMKFLDSTRKPVDTPSAMLTAVELYLSEFSNRVNESQEIVKKMMDTPFRHMTFRALLDRLMYKRICHDTHDKSIHKIDPYPLNSSQINAGVERFLIDETKAIKENRFLSFWEAMQAFNYALKPTISEIPSLIQQNSLLTKVFIDIMSDLTD